MKRVTYRPLDTATVESSISHLPTTIWAKFESEPDSVKLPCMSFSVSYDEKRKEIRSWLHCEFDDIAHALMNRSANEGEALLFGIENGDRRTLMRAHVMEIK